MLHVKITVAPASGPSPLRGHIAATRESGELVDFVVVPVHPGNADGGAVAAPGNGNGNGSGDHGASHDTSHGRTRRATADPGAAELEPFLPAGVGGLLAAYEASGAAAR